MSKQQYDIILPPYKVVKPNPLLRAFGLQDMNNWAYSYLQISENEDKLKQLLKRKVNVFVVDTAAFIENDNLKDFVDNTLSKDFTNDPQPIDLHGHGTHVCGCVASKHPQYKLGVASVMEGFLKIIPVKAGNKDGGFAYSWIENALRYIRSLDIEGVKVINMSFGGPSGNATIENLIKEMSDEGIFFFGAAGNSGYNEDRDTVQFPGWIDEVIASAAIDSNSLRAWFSSVGIAVDLASPGVNIWSTFKDGSLVKFNGTSMASPITAGIASIILSINPDIKTVKQLQEFLFKYITDLGPESWDKFYGHGTPKIGPYIDQEPDKPEEPSEPEGELKTFYVPLPDVYKVKYKDSSSDKYQNVFFSAILRVTSDKPAELTSEFWNNYFKDYFRRKWYSFGRDVDIYDVGFYINEFWEIFDERGQIGADIYEMTISDQKGNTIMLRDLNDLPRPTSLTAKIQENGSNN